MRLEEFKSGGYKEQFQYKSFQPDYYPRAMSNPQPAEAYPVSVKILTLP